MSNISESSIEKNDLKRDENKEQKLKAFKIIIFKLNQEQRAEKKFYKRRKINLKLKRNIEKALELSPDDIGLKINLMYTYINLNELDSARNMGDELLSKTDLKSVFNGVSIIEERKGNYDKAIECIEKILEKEPNNQALRKRIEILNCKKDNIPIDKNLFEKEKIYRKIATLERKVISMSEEQQGEFARRGEKANKNEIVRQNFVKVYKQISEIAKSMVEQYPDEVVAREKLVKSLYIIGDKEEAEKEIEGLLKIYDKDEIGLWYLSKIQRDNHNLEGEKEALERILDNSQPGEQIRVQQRLEKVNNLIEKKKKKEKREEEIRASYTEDRRKEFIADIQKEFLHGNINQNEIDEKIEEARKYPNFDKSLIEILDIKSKMTGNKDEKINKLEEYVNTEKTITEEGYKNVLDAISETREEIKNDEMIEKYVDKKQETEKQERKEKSQQQREYSKEIIERLNKGEITKEELPEIVKKLETSIDRTKAIFLITKLYEILYGRREASKQLIKYTYLSDLSPKEKRTMAEMQKALTSGKKEKGKTRKIKDTYKKKEQKQQRYVKKVQKEKIKQFLDEGKSVKQIFNLLKDSGIALSTITAVKGHYIKGNEALEKERREEEEDAKALLKGGYTPEEVYEFLEYNLPISSLKNMDKEIRKEEEGIEI